MDKTDLSYQRDVVDFITNAMLSISFLELATRRIADGKANEMTLQHFYETWNRSVGPERKVPMSPGILMGYLYCGIVLAKENWLELLPGSSGSAKDLKWKLERARVTDSLDSNPSIRHVARRLRNALSHAWVKWDVPIGRLTSAEIWSNTKLTFHDEGPRTGSFDAEASMSDLAAFVKAFHAEIYAHAKE